MSRIRTVKPEFWENEKLSALPEATHMLAAALLNYADDEGFFHANPLLIRARCSPLREPSVAIGESLRLLCEDGYLTIGTTPDGRAYGRINHFLEHQRISHPAKSKIACLDIVWPEISGKAPEGSGAAPRKRRKAPAPLRPEPGTGNREQGTGTPPNPLAGADPAGEPSVPAPSVIADAVDAYHEAAELFGWSRVEIIGRDRERKLRRRIEEAGGIDGWRLAMTRAAGSGFLTGRLPRGQGHENWRPDFGFFVQAKSFHRLMEGYYDDKPDLPGAAGQQLTLGQVMARVLAEPDPGAAPGDPGRDDSGVSD